MCRSRVDGRQDSSSQKCRSYGPVTRGYVICQTAASNHPALRHTLTKSLRLSCFVPVALLCRGNRAQVTVNRELRWGIGQLLAVVLWCWIFCVHNGTDSLARVLVWREPIRKEHATPGLQADELERFSIQWKGLFQQTQRVRRVERPCPRQICEFARSPEMVFVSPLAAQNGVGDDPAHGVAKQRAWDTAAVLNLARNGHEVGEEIAIQKWRGPVDVAARGQLGGGLELQTVRFSADRLIDGARVRAVAARPGQRWTGTFDAGRNISRDSCISVDDTLTHERAQHAAQSMRRQMERQLALKLSAEISSISVDKPSRVFLEMAGNLWPFESCEKVGQIRGHEGELIAPMARQHRPRTLPAAPREHRPLSKPPIVKARRFGVPRGLV